MEIRSWDRDARIAVLVTVMFETWHEGKAPSDSPMTTPLREGTVDRHGISWSEYGGRTGIWRIMRTLGEFGIQAQSVSVAGRWSFFRKRSRNSTEEDMRWLATPIPRIRSSVTSRRKRRGKSSTGAAESSKELLG